MVYSLIAALQPYEIETPWGTAIVRPPSVREALTILASYEGALDDAPVDTGIFFDILDGWLPSKIVATMKGSDRGTVVQWVFGVINAGVPKFHQVTSGDYEGGGGWTSVVTDYVSVYPYTVDQVMDEKWPVFLIMAAGIGQVRARQSLQMLHVKGIENTSDQKERQQHFDELYALAKYPKMTEEARQRVRDEAQEQALKAMNARFAHHRTENIGRA